jgi:hypothetical protein
VEMPEGGGRHLRVRCVALNGRKSIAEVAYEDSEMPAEGHYRHLG